MLRLKEIRESKGYTQDYVAEILGLSRPAYTRYESGSRECSFDTLKKLAKIFNVSIDYILGEENKPQIIESTNNFIAIPLVKEIHATIPIMAQENIIGEELVPKLWIDDGDYFVLEVMDDTMSDVGILLGGKALIRQQSNCEDGNIAAVIIDGEGATLKRVFLRPERNEIELVPENRKYPRKYYPTSKITICGIAKKAWQDL